MRDIKFRGKRVDNGEWVKGCLLTRSDGKTFIVKECDLESYDGETTDLLCIDWYEVIPETVGQYTGLKDKNGLEIYEGDIVKDKWKPNSEVLFGEYDNGEVYEDIQAGIGFYLKNDKWIESFCDKNIEVIGNIHDNPELLEVQE